MTEDTACSEIATILTRVLESSAPGDGIGVDSSIIELGVDSLTIVDLAVELEDRFGIEHLPIQDWVDAETEAAAPRYTVRSLARMCLRLSSAYEASGG